MKTIRQNSVSILFFLTLLLVPSLYGHGFAEHTLIKKANHWWTIEQILANPQHEKISVLSFDDQSQQLALQPVRNAGRGTTNCYCEVTISDGNEHTDEIIKCTPTQEFFVPYSGRWIPAYQLKFGDVLFSTEEVPRWVRNVSLHKQPITVFSIEVENSHNFFVGRHTVLTHNMVLPVMLTCGLSIPFGAGAVAGGATGCFLGPIAVAGGFIFGGLASATVKALINRSKTPEYNLSINIGEVERQLNNPPYMLEEKVEDKGKISPPSETPEKKSKEEKKEAPKTVEDILKGAERGRGTKGKTTQHEKPGGFAEALEDFKSLQPTDIKNTDKGKIGKLPGNKNVNVRNTSKDSRPTLEILDKQTRKKIKIRYGNK